MVKSRNFEKSSQIKVDALDMRRHKGQQFKLLNA